MGTKKYELSFYVKIGNGSNQRNTVVVDVDDSIAPKLGASKTKDQAISGLVGHMFPNGEITAGIAKRVYDKPTSSSSTKKSSKSAKKESIQFKNPFRKPFYWFPFRIIWSAILIVWYIIVAIISDKK